LWQPSDEHRQRIGAAEIGAQARALQWPAEQRYAYLSLGFLGRTDLFPWLAFYSRRVPLGVEGPRAVPRDELLLRLSGGRLVAIRGEGAVAP
jgi:hypothetical protein